MRSIKELLELMLKHQDIFETGLCIWLIEMCYPSLPNRKLITNEEYVLLLTYINKNRPSKWSSIDAFAHKDSNYYWSKGSIKPRIKWIKYHIKKNS